MTKRTAQQATNWAWQHASALTNLPLKMSKTLADKAAQLASQDVLGAGADFVSVAMRGNRATVTGWREHDFCVCTRIVKVRLSRLGNTWQHHQTITLR